MQLIDPTHAGYETGRKIWNGAIDRRPHAIAKVEGPAEVAAVIREARAAGRGVTVRCGGHSAPGHCVMDGATVIDLSLLRTVEVDAKRAVARASGGCLWQHLDAATAEHGLATTGGLISHTGVGGLTLGGGIGWLMRKHGLAIDNLIAAEVVLADGNQVRASETENADLFWALRGGGGNFGVVTSFEFRLHPVKTVVAGMTLYPATRANAILRFWRELTQSAPDELTTMFAFLTAPPAPFIPPHLQGTPMVAILACYAGDPAAGAEAVRPLRSYGPPAVDLIGEMPYVALQSMLDPGAPHGLHYYMKSAQLDELTDAAIDDIALGAKEMTSPLSAVHLHHLGGAVARVPEGATAYAGRRSAYTFNIIPAWQDGSTSATHIAWTRALYDLAAKHSNGSVYVNFLGDEGPDRVRAAFGAEKFAKLGQIKRRYDPENIFRFNQNIRPG